MLSRFSSCFVTQNGMEWNGLNHKYPFTSSVEEELEKERMVYVGMEEKEKQLVKSEICHTWFRLAIQSDSLESKSQGLKKVTFFVFE